MSYSAQAAGYLEADILSRPKEWLVPLLYEHLLASLRRAAIQVERGDVEGKVTSLEKATTIIFELAATLDHERGGELASGLSALYAYFAGEVVAAGTSHNPERLGRLVDLVAELHEAWVQAAESAVPRGRIGSRAVRVGLA